MFEKSPPFLMTLLHIKKLFFIPNSVFVSLSFGALHHLSLAKWKGVESARKAVKFFSSVLFVHFDDF